MYVFYSTICKCISVARYGCHNVGIAQPSPEKNYSDHIVPNSGATSHIRRNISDFEDAYVTCNDVFVLVGNNLEIPMLGFGTSQMKIDSHVTRLVNSICTRFRC